jgi:hypothetical protein
MRKILLAAALAAVIAVTQGCAVKRGVGLVNNELTYREDYGKVTAEISAGAAVNNSFSDFEDLLPPMPPSIYLDHKQENGQVSVAVPVGIGVYYKLFTNDVFALSAGLKYYDYFAYNYDYIYYYEKRTSESIYDYTENVRIDYFSSNKASVIFPDVEIKLPFFDNLRLAVNVELIYLRWYYSGGYYTSAYERRLSNSTGNTTPVDRYSYISPGRVTGVNVGSGLFYLGTINMGVMYYF